MNKSECTTSIDASNISCMYTTVRYLLLYLRRYCISEHNFSDHYILVGKGEENGTGYVLNHATATVTSPPSPEFSSVIFPCRRCRHDHITKGTYKKAILPGWLRVAEFKRLLSERHALLSPHSDQHVVYTVHTNTQLTILTHLFWAREVLHVHSYEFPILYT